MPCWAGPVEDVTMKNTAPIDIEVRKRAGEEQTPREPELGLIIDTIPALALSLIHI